MFPKRIVVPLDGSQFALRAVPVACAIMRPPGGQVLLVTTEWDGDDVAPRDYLTRTAATFSGMNVETLVVQNRDAAGAIELAASREPDQVICMTSHGRGRVRWALLGSVAEQVVSHARGPVVLIGRESRTAWPDGLQRILVGVDGSTRQPAVLPVALDWARQLELDVHLANVIHPLDTTAPDGVLDQMEADIEASGLRVEQTIVRSSYPAGALADLADTLDAGLIAMDSHARTGVARLALGSVTMGVVGMAHCPVLVTKTP